MEQLIVLFERQIIGAAIIGVGIVALFRYLAQRDAEEPLARTKPRVVGAVVFFALAGMMTILFAVQLSHCVNAYSALILCLAFECAALGVYLLWFRRSPRGGWVKFRKVLGYYMIMNIYPSLITLTMPALIVPSAYGIGRLTGMGFSILTVWLLIHHYEGERYVPHRRDSQEATPFPAMQPHATTVESNADLEKA